jgi:hypothetical protein
MGWQRRLVLSVASAGGTAIPVYNRLASEWYFAFGKFESKDRRDRPIHFSFVRNVHCSGKA